MDHSNNKKRRPPQTKVLPRLRVGGARNVHGTRISKRITCEKCGAEDHIVSRPQKGRPVWCRACAQEAIQAFEIGVQMPFQKVEKICSVCGCTFLFPAHIVPKNEQLLCLDCLKGFDIWRGSVNMSPETREKMTLETRPSGTLLRKKSGDKGLPKSNDE